MLKSGRGLQKEEASLNIKMLEKGVIEDHDPETLSALYNAFVNAYYQEYYLMKADGKDTTALEKKMQKQMAVFVGLFKK